MRILEQVPGMDDEQLATLRRNAERLSTDGNDKQKAAAAEVLDAVVEEIEVRSAAKRKVMAERRAAAKTSKVKSKAV